MALIACNRKIVESNDEYHYVKTVNVSVSDWERVEANANAESVKSVRDTQPGVGNKRSRGSDDPNLGAKEEKIGEFGTFGIPLSGGTVLVTQR